MDSVINAVNSKIDEDYCADNCSDFYNTDYDGRTDYGDSNLPYNSSRYTDNDSKCFNNVSDLEAVKPRKVVASQSDFQQKFKTEICRNWEISKCKFGTECTFAHGEHEL